MLGELVLYWVWVWVLNLISFARGYLKVRVPTTLILHNAFVHVFPDLGPFFRLFRLSSFSRSLLLRPFFVFLHSIDISDLPYYTGRMKAYEQKPIVKDIALP
ncbi:hypothetical protein BDP27DRAFT_1321094 [Rhodocollybia butyracea]|uniref:Uncharacterized protein n=1 Tax=Rhodocollybia butyracea TaxID=206335 RepID=A0A9P5UAJ4_9AGAR|nr:hypothetical protein BDP27DRAFT_1321094 [Rhodocollybia butyracea]